MFLINNQNMKFVKLIIISQSIFLEKLAVKYLNTNYKIAAETFGANRIIHGFNAAPSYYRFASGQKYYS